MPNPAGGVKKRPGKDRKHPCGSSVRHPCLTRFESAAPDGAAERHESTSVLLWIGIQLPPSQKQTARSRGPLPVTRSRLRSELEAEAHLDGPARLAGDVLAEQRGRGHGARRLVHERTDV